MQDICRRTSTMEKVLMNTPPATCGNSMALDKLKNAMKNFDETLVTIERTRLKTEMTLTKVAEVQATNHNENCTKNKKCRCLKKVLSDARANTENEIDEIELALDKLQEIRKISAYARLEARFGIKETIRKTTLMKSLISAAQTLPLFIRKDSHSKIPPLVGCIPAGPLYVANSRDIVAAHVKFEENEEENWITAEVVQFDARRQIYVVEDIDDDDRTRYKVQKRRTIPLPLMRANPQTEPEALFKRNDSVLALFPQTTCFYKAEVLAVPEFVHEDYLVSFEDVAHPYLVPQRYVLKYVTIKSKNTCN